jgi:hypothetical protein
MCMMLRQVTTIGRVTTTLGLAARRPTSAMQPSLDDLSLTAAAHRRPLSAARYR